MTCTKLHDDLLLFCNERLYELVVGRDLVINNRKTLLGFAINSFASLLGLIVLMICNGKKNG